jgi:toxin ParE1/3/4
LKPLRVALLARRDIDDLLRTSDETFGSATAERYRQLLEEAIRLIRTDPERVGVSTRLGPTPDLRLFHLRLARLRMPPAQRIARPRHVLVFRFVDGVVDLVRVLHDAVDLPRRLGGEES